MSILDNIMDNDIDPRYEMAAETLLKIAEEDGIDLDSLGDEDIAGLITEIAEDDAAGSDDGDAGDPAGSDDGDTGGPEDGGEEKISQVTHGVVARELNKIASAEDIDLSKISQAEYDSLFDELAGVMTQPGYFEKQSAAREKLAEADAIGRAMAHSFDDELRKLAEQEKTALSRGLKAKALLERGKRNIGEAAKGLGERASAAEKRLSVRAGRALRGGEKGQTERIRRQLKQNKMPEGGHGAAKAEDVMRSRTVGRRALGGAAAGTAAAGAGGAAYAGRDKKSYDEDVLYTARAILAESGIDPDTGVKVAEDYEATVMNSAIALLQDNGYIIE